MERAYDKYRSTHSNHLRSDGVTEETLYQLLPLLGGRRNQRIVELGCGGGELLSALMGRGYNDVIGVDFSPEQVESAAQLGIAVVAGDAESFLRDLEGPPGVILAIDLLEHIDLEELLDLVQCSFDRLTTGGLLIARLPNPQSPFGGAVAFGDLTHRTHLAPTAAQQLLRLAGFSEIVVLPCAPAPAGWRRSVRQLLWKGQQRLFRAMFSIESGLDTQTVFSMNFLVVGRKGPPHIG